MCGAYFLMAALPSNPKSGIAINSLDPYKPAFSKVVYAWNGMQQSLGLLFCEISGLDGKMGLGIWHALKNNRVQYDLLEAALAAASTDGDFTSQLPKACEDIKWLLDSINLASDGDTGAVRAKIFSLVDQNAEMPLLTIYEKLDERNMLEENLVAELDSYEAYLNTLSEFASTMSVALSCHRHNELGLHRPWPNRPILPPTRVASIEATRGS
jgi:hypothetical protein